MLLMLSQWLQGLSPEFGFFRVFQYLTFRAVMAAMTALLIGLVAGLVCLWGVNGLKRLIGADDSLDAVRAAAAACRRCETTGCFHRPRSAGRWPGSPAADTTPWSPNASASPPSRQPTRPWPAPGSAAPSRSGE